MNWMDCEFVFTRFGVERETYVYHYQDENNKRIVRYDNTEHFPHLSNFPHHKHTPKNVVASSAPILKEVLKEIIDTDILTPIDTDDKGQHCQT